MRSKAEQELVDELEGKVLHIRAHRIIPYDTNSVEVIFTIIETDAEYSFVVEVDNC